MTDGHRHPDPAADQRPDTSAGAATPGDPIEAGPSSGQPAEARSDAPAGDIPADAFSGGGEPRGANPAPAGVPADGGDAGPADPVAEADEQAEADEAGAEDPMTALAVERDDYRDALVRLQADFENYKKRMMKQQTDHLERAAGTLVEKLLPVLDTADLALAHGSGEDVKQLAGTLSGVLDREGLERIDPLGAAFDPMLHDAVAHEPGEGGQEVVEVLRAGYRWKGKVLRPAMVKVRG
jgi:molecular chaperone GrpE